MFDETNALEERKLLQQIVTIGVGYHCYRSFASRSAISDANMLHSYIPKMLNSRKHSDIDGEILKSLDHIQNGDDGYYLLDLHKGRILAGGQHPVEDVIIGFTLSGTDDPILLRRRKWDRFHDIVFLIAPNGVYFLEMNRVYIPVSDFHMMSFISLDDNSRFGFVVDYDETQNNRPLVLLPCEENNDIIQSQLDYDDHCWREENRFFLRKYRL